jgi:acyl carrier protein
MPDPTIDDRLRAVFSAALSIPAADVQDGLTFNKTERWDSISHMQLITAIDEEFGTMLETEDIIALSSFAKGREIVARYLQGGG